MPFSIHEIKLAVPHISLSITFYITIHHHVISHPNHCQWCHSRHLTWTQDKVLGTTKGAAAQTAAWHQAITEITGHLVHNQVSCIMTLTNIHARTWFRPWQIVPTGSLSWLLPVTSRCCSIKTTDGQTGARSSRTTFLVNQTTLGSRSAKLIWEARSQHLWQSFLGP